MGKWAIPLLTMELLQFDGLPTHQVEGCHSQLKIENVGTPHPYILELITNKEEATTRMKMQLYESGAKEPRNVREREQRVQTLFQQLIGGITEYWESFEYQTGL